MITVLSGGTGTPKLLQGLKEVIDPKDITIVVNTLENDYHFYLECDASMNIFQVFMYQQTLTRYCTLWLI